MNGNMVSAVRFPEVIKEVNSPEDIDLLVPHQANSCISEYVSQQMATVMNNIQIWQYHRSIHPNWVLPAWEMGNL